MTRKLTVVDPATIIKGGPGSGFHGHAGRQGERGGSAPDGTTPANQAEHGQGLARIANAITRKHGLPTQIKNGQVVARSKAGFAVFSESGRQTDWSETLQSALESWERISEEIKRKQELARQKREVEERKAAQMGRLARG